MGNIFSAAGLSELLLSLPAVMWAITFHEFCHGYAAKKLGDPTAENAGRLSLNPLDHLDPIGALCLLFFRFGWAKPIPIDVRYFKKPKRDIILVSLAGPLGNILTAFICVQLVNLVPILFKTWAAGQFILLMIFINVGLAAFNLVPIPPLDGSRILYVLLPPEFIKIYYWLERYGMLVVMLLLVTGIFPRLMRPIYMLLFNLLLI